MKAKTPPEQDLKTPPSSLPAVLPRDPHISEATGQQRSARDIHVGGLDHTLGPSEVPANATLPAAEAIVPGKGRSPK